MGSRSAPRLQISGVTVDVLPVDQPTNRGPSHHFPPRYQGDFPSRKNLERLAISTKRYDAFRDIRKIVKSTSENDLTYLKRLKRELHRKKEKAMSSGEEATTTRMLVATEILINPYFMH